MWYLSELPADDCHVDAAVVAGCSFFSHQRCAAPSDEIDMESLDALQKYLDAESIEHNDAMPLKHLQMLVAQQVKRRARERGEAPKKPKPDAIDCMSTLHGVKRAMVRLSEDLRSTDEQVFGKTCFVIDTMAGQHLVKIKHHADWSRVAGAASAVPLRQAC